MTTDPRIAALAEALLRAVPGYQRWVAYPADTHSELQNRTAAMEAELYAHAAAILAALPDDWCGHSESVWNGQFAEIARLRKIEEAARAAAREPFWCNWGAGQNAALDALRAALEAER